MPQGTVKWFNESKGYGFIESEPGNAVYVHHTAILGMRFRTLREGQKVEFEVQETDHGLHAANVVCH